MLFYYTFAATISCTFLHYDLRLYVKKSKQEGLFGNPTTRNVTMLIHTQIPFSLLYRFNLVLPRNHLLLC